MSQTPLWESMPLAKLGKPSNGQKERPEPVRRGGRLSVSFITVEMPGTCAPKRWAELQGRSVGGGTSGGGGRGGHRHSRGSRQPLGWDPGILLRYAGPPPAVRRARAHADTDRRTLTLDLEARPAAPAHTWAGKDAPENARPGPPEARARAAAPCRPQTREPGAVA